MTQYASAIEIAKVEQLQKEIQLLIKKIHHPFYNFLALFVIPILLNRLWVYYFNEFFITMEDTIQQLKAVLKPDQITLFEKYQQANKEMEDLASYLQSTLASKNPLQIAMARSRSQAITENFDSLSIQVNNLIFDNPEAQHLYRTFDTTALETFFTKVAIALAITGFTLTKFFSRFLHNKLIQYLPFGLLHFNTNYRNIPLDDLLEPYALMKVRFDINNKKTQGLVNLRNKLLSTHQFLRNLSRIVLMGILSYYALFPYAIFSFFQFFVFDGILLGTFFSLLPTALSNLLNDPINACIDVITQQETKQQLNFLNELSENLNLRKWELKEGLENSSAIFILNVKNKKMSDALQNAFEYNNINVLAWTSNQIVLDKNIKLNFAIIQKIIANYQEEITLQEKSEKKEIEFLDEKSITETIIHSEPKSTGKLINKSSTCLIENKLEKFSTDNKKEDKPIIINFGQYGIYNSQDKTCNIKKLQSNFWNQPHYGVITVPEKEFDDKNTYNKFQSVLATGNVVGPEGQQGIKKMKEKIRMKGIWKKGFYEIKPLKMDDRIIQTKPNVVIEGCNLHVFDYYPSKAHR